MSDSKARYWVAVMYPENMIDNWEDVISEKLQRPYAYCIHDKCFDENGEIRKTHVHLILVYGSPTTYKNALSVFKELEKPDCVAVNKCERVIGIRYMYDYLIHDTDNAKQKGKYQYPAEERKTGNGFDIGAYEQLTLTDKNNIKREISQIIVEKRILNFYDLNNYVMENMSEETFEVFTQNQNYFANLVKGYFTKVYSQSKGMFKELNDFLDKQESLKTEE